MKDEIKEILDKLKDKNNYISHSMILLSIKETHLLLDYITNLQNTNKNHSKKLMELGNEITNLQQENKMYSQLKDEYTNIINDALYKLYDNEMKLDREFYNEMLEILLGRNNL